MRYVQSHFTRRDSPMYERYLVKVRNHPMKANQIRAEMVNKGLNPDFLDQPDAALTKPVPTKKEDIGRHKLLLRYCYTGGIPLIITYLLQRSSIAEMVDDACRMLGKMAAQSNDAKGDIGAQGAIQMMQKAMERHSNNAELCTQVLLTFAELTSNHEGNLAILMNNTKWIHPDAGPHKQLPRGRGLKQLVEVLERHKNNPVLVCQGFKTLRSLAQLEHVQIELGELGCVKLCMELVFKYLPQTIAASEPRLQDRDIDRVKLLEQLQEAGIGAVQILSKYEDNLIKIARDQGQKYIKQHISFFVQRDLLEWEKKATKLTASAKEKAIANRQMEKILQHMKKARWTEIKTQQKTIQLAQRVLKAMLIKRLVLAE